MRNYIIRRILLGILTIFLVSLVVNSMLYIMPGNVAQAVLGMDATPEEVMALRAKLGLDQPFIIQYFRWLASFLKGNSGTSVMYNIDVKNLIAQRLPVTFYFGALALIIGNFIGILMGIITAFKRGSFLDSFITTIVSLCISVPSFWLALLLIYLVGMRLSLLPIFGFTMPYNNFILSIRQTIMPLFILSLFPMAVSARQTRSAMLETIHQDYMRTARSKGLTEKAILIRHGLKNAMIPVVTLIFMGIPMIVAGSVLTENVFSIPGMGRLLVSSAQNKDIVVVQVCVMIIAVIVVFANLMADIVYCWLDPRIRYD